MVNKTHLHELDSSTVVTLYNPEVQKPIAQFKNKKRAAAVLNVFEQNLTTALARNGRVDCREQFGIMIAVRLRAKNPELILDPKLDELKQIIASQMS